jgi:hypothetical protein
MKLSKAKLKTQQGKNAFAKAHAKAPVGSYIVTDHRNGFASELPVGKVVGHLKYRASVRGCGPLLVEKYEIYPDEESPNPLGVAPQIVVSKERYIRAIEAKIRGIEFQKRALLNFRPSGKIVNPRSLPNHETQN